MTVSSKETSMTDELKTGDYSHCENCDEHFHADMVDWKGFLDWIERIEHSEISITGC